MNDKNGGKIKQKKKKERSKEEEKYQEANLEGKL